jgi:hypothetical protein
VKIGPNPTRGCVDGVTFHGLLLSETEFRQHLPAVLQIHVLAGRLCIRRTTGRWCRNSASSRSGPWKVTPSMHPRAVQSSWTIRNRYGHRYAEICIFPTVSLSNGRRLTGLRDLEHKTFRGVYVCHLAVLQTGASRTVQQVAPTSCKITNYHYILQVAPTSCKITNNCVMLVFSSPSSSPPTTTTSRRRCSSPSPCQ